MGGMRLLPEESDVAMVRTPAAATDLISDDDRSVAADSWSIKSEYGSTLDDEQRHADATEALAAVNYRAASDYSSDKEEQDAEGVSSMLGFQSYWDSAYADELANFREHGHAGEVWFGADVMEIVTSWTKALCSNNCQNHLSNHVVDGNPQPVGLGLIDKVTKCQRSAKKEVKPAQVSKTKKFKERRPSADRAKLNAATLGGSESW
ncbi:uncharacterized protein LOC107785994 isoform X2 [Nicotiana tabacum]|uniref:Uncharacterized protein LOC107785994 isoform X2 n=1 Tax=Nicotiana tabacum TaxID=4097 RepID=A0AC58TMF5_TOBAC